MNRMSLAMVLLLASAALMSSAEVQAQARSSAHASTDNNRNTHGSAEARARKLMELDAWLRRLMGNFRVDGTVLDYDPTGTLRSIAGRLPLARKPKGSVQCFGIGAGPGVHCLVDVTWLPLSNFGLNADTYAWSEAFNALHPGMMLLALDPDALKVQLMLADDRGNADTWAGDLTGDTVVFRESAHGCWGFNPNHCPRRFEMIAKPESESISLEMSYPISGSFHIYLELHRLPDDKAGGISKKP